MCVYQRVRNICFSENLTYFVFLKHSFWDLPFCFIMDDFMHRLTIISLTVFLRGTCYVTLYCIRQSLSSRNVSCPFQCRDWKMKICRPWHHCKDYFHDTIAKTVSMTPMQRLFPWHQCKDCFHDTNTETTSMTPMQRLFRVFRV